MPTTSPSRSSAPARSIPGDTRPVAYLISTITGPFGEVPLIVDTSMTAAAPLIGVSCRCSTSGAMSNTRRRPSWSSITLPWPLMIRVVRVRLFL